MKRFLVLALFVGANFGAALAASAPAGKPATVPDSVQALPEAQFNAWVQGERDQIAKEKAAIAKRYHDAGFTCWHRFAVNDCLRDARRQRRAKLAPVTKTELAVNAAQRDYETRQRLQEIAQKQKK
jgi:hypothetical protein